GTTSQTADSAWFAPGFVEALAGVPGVVRASAQRTRPLLLDSALPAVVLLARDMDDATRSLPLVGSATPVPQGAVAVYVSEAVVDLYGARPGEPLPMLARALGADAPLVVAGVWRDYVRQTGAIAMRRSDYVRLTADRRANDVQLWLTPD